MQYVVASASDGIVGECRRVLGHIDKVEVRLGSVPVTGWDCDAAVLSWPLAHERYGGSPQVGRVQVLINQRGDGAPEIILATAPISIEDVAVDPGDDEIERHALSVLDTCMSAFVRVFPGRAKSARVLVHLEAAGIDRYHIEAPLKGVLGFFDAR